MNYIREHVTLFHMVDKFNNVNHAVSITVNIICNLNDEKELPLVI